VYPRFGWNDRSLSSTMYANQYGPLSNNPFVGDPTTAHARYPDLNASNIQPGYPSNGYPNHPQQYPQQFQQYPSQSYSPYQAHPQAIPQQYASPSQFQPQGQVAQPTSLGFTSPGFSQLQQYPANYPSAYRQPTPNLLAEFDPYAQQQQGQAQAQGMGPAGIAHPRDLIRTYKSQLEAWDTYSWKQLLGACDTLKDAWATRKAQAERIVRQYGGNDPGLFGPDPAFGYNPQLDGWRQVLKDANNHFDTITASTFQLHEVFNSYRHSGDLASKQRVRESCNAAVKGMPDWPGN